MQINEVQCCFEPQWLHYINKNNLNIQMIFIYVLHKTKSYVLTDMRVSKLYIFIFGGLSLYINTGLKRKKKNLFVSQSG